MATASHLQRAAVTTMTLIRLFHRSCRWIWTAVSQLVVDPLETCSLALDKCHHGSDRVAASLLPPCEEEESRISQSCTSATKWTSSRISWTGVTAMEVMEWTGKKPNSRNKQKKKNRALFQQNIHRVSQPIIILLIRFIYRSNIIEYLIDIPQKSFMFSTNLHIYIHIARRCDQERQPRSLPHISQGQV